LLSLFVFGFTRDSMIEVKPRTEASDFRRRLALPRNRKLCWKLGRMFYAISEAAPVLETSARAPEQTHGEHAEQARQSIAIETKDLRRAVGDKVLVNGVSVQVYKGETLAVVGPSGAGKSSFLRLLNRLDEPTGGTVLLGGSDYRAMAPEELRRRVGMVMQTAYLFPGTVAANIAFGPLQRHETLSLQQIGALLERIGLPGYQDRDVSNLSGGEAQRVSLARTLANSPEVLLLDEPTSALDEKSARGIEELLLGIVRERQMTCVMITHDMQQAARTADRIMHLEAGRLAALVPNDGVSRAG
jgi:putative ABC transport system ATP-binding protein